eukprot:PhF_6_TR26376/c0_g1_i1/m.38027
MSDAKRRKHDELNTQGKNAFQRGDYVNAIKSWSQCIDENPSDHLMYSNRSAAYLKNNEPERALKDAEVVIKLSPGFAKGWHRVGSAHEIMRHFPEALEAYRKAASLEPSTVSYESDVRRIQDLLERSGSSIQNSAATRTAFQLEKYQSRAKAAFDTQDFTSAIRLYTQAIELITTSRECMDHIHLLYSNRSAAYMRLEKLDEALSDAKECVARCASYAKGYVRVSTAFIAMEKFEDAKRILQQGLLADPTSDAIKEALENTMKLCAQRDAENELKKMKQQERQEELVRLATEAPEEAVLPISGGKYNTELVCSRCGAVGHKAQDCDANLGSNRVRHTNSYDHCNLCNSFGHKAKDCPQKFR